MTTPRFNGLDEPVRDQGLAWLERVAPDRWVTRFEMHDEGRCKLTTTLAGERTADDVTVFRAGHDGGIVTRILHATEMPPLAVLQAMEVAA